MQAFTPADGSEGYWGFNFPGFPGSSNNDQGPMTTTLPSTAALAMAFQQGPAPQQNYAAAPYYSQTISPMMTGSSTNSNKETPECLILKPGLQKPNL